MLKLAGNIIIFMCCTALGFLKAVSYKDRRKEIESIIELLELMKIEISYRKDPLPKTLRRVAESKSCWFSDVMNECAELIDMQKPLIDSWEIAVSNNMNKCPLTKEDLLVIRDIPMGLGRSDSDNQEKVLKPIGIRLRERYDLSLEIEKKQGRMFRSMGIATGAVIVIILI